VLHNNTLNAIKADDRVIYRGIKGKKEREREKESEREREREKK